MGVGAVVFDVAEKPETLWNGTPGPVDRRKIEDKTPRWVKLIANADNQGVIVIGPCQEIIAAVATRLGGHVLAPGQSLIMRADGNSSIDLDTIWVVAETASDRVHWEVWDTNVARVREV